jgi:hypothetical protein
VEAVETSLLRVLKASNPPGHEVPQTIKKYRKKPGIAPNKSANMLERQGCTGGRYDFIRGALRQAWMQWMATQFIFAILYGG